MSVKSDSLHSACSLDPEVEALVAEVVAQGLDDPTPPPDRGPAWLKDLHDQALQTCMGAVARVDEEAARQLNDMGERLRAEQQALHDRIMTDLEGAVRRAAEAGQRHATVLSFSGADRFDEFCYLYMLKGPLKPELHAEMKAMGVAPLLPRLRRELRAAGFDVHHAWQRATNENSITVTW